MDVCGRVGTGERVLKNALTDRPSVVVDLIFVAQVFSLLDINRDRAGRFRIRMRWWERKVMACVFQPGQQLAGQAQERCRGSVLEKVVARAGTRS